MKEIKIMQILTDEEVDRYCEKNNLTLIMVSRTDKETIIKAVYNY